MKEKIAKNFSELLKWAKVFRWTLQLGARGKTNTGKRNLLFLYRNDTWISWSLYLAFSLVKEGQSVVLVYNEADIKAQYPRAYSFVLWVINKIAVEAVRMDDIKPSGKHSISKQKLYRQIAYDMRIEEGKVETLEDLPNMLPKYEHSNLVMLEILNGIASRHKLDNIYIYSGIISTTATILDFGLQHGIRTVTFEGWSWKPGLIVYGIDKPSLDFGFRPRFDKEIGTRREEITGFYNDYVDFIEGRQASGWFSDFHNIQSKVPQNKIPEKFTEWITPRKENLTVLLATNMVGDSATLGREKFYESQEAWLRDSLKYLVEHTNYNIIVRIHPIEEQRKNRLKFLLGDILQEFQPYFYNRIYPVFAADKFNTLSLVDYVDCTIVWTSTVGADFAAKGVLAINTARSSYADFDFALAPDDEATYKDMVVNLEGFVEKYKMDEESRLRAKGYFFYLLKENAHNVFGDSYNLAGAQLDNRVSKFISEIQN